MTEPGLVPCVGCGALVPDVTWPIHRYIGASPGCWSIYAEVYGGGLLPPLRAPYGALIADAYAAQHPGVPGPQSTQSVWVHLIVLQLVLEAGWATTRLIDLRKAVGEVFPDLPWLEPPESLGEVAFPDLDAASDGPLDDLAARWVEGVWAAWAAHHDPVRTKAAELAATFD